MKSGRIVSKKFKGAKGKRDETRGANGEKEVELFIGLVEWNESQECLKRKHEKRMALKVKKDDPPAVLLQKAYLSHCYDANEDYVLLLPPFSLLRDFSFQNTSEHFAIRFRQSYLIWKVCVMLPQLN